MFECAKKPFRYKFMKFYFIKCFSKFEVCFTCMPLARVFYINPSLKVRSIGKNSKYPHSSI